MYNCVVNRFKAAGDKIFFNARRKYIDLEILLRTFSVYKVQYMFMYIINHINFHVHAP